MTLNNNLELGEGISIITPIYKAEKYISILLNSMKHQTIDYNLFEHIFIINGELDGTKKIIEDFKEKNPKMNIKLFYSELANASNARNIGIEKACRDYSTFIDADDFISPNFLEQMFKHAKQNRIVVSNIIDVDEDKKYNSSPIDKQISNNQGVIGQPLINISMVLTINACKLIPTNIIKKTRFNIDLGSGEDIVFFCNLVVLNDLQFFVLKPKTAIYYRFVRSHSVSRRPLSYGFNVKERLKVIKELNNLLITTEDIEKQEFIKQKIRAQTSFINKYLNHYPNDIQRVHKAINSSCFAYFSYSDLNKNLAKTLVVSYCFPPYVDTSANVMGKRVRELNSVVDVIQNNMNDMRQTDDNLNGLVDEFIENRIVINSHQSFGNWDDIKDFCEMGMEQISHRISDKKHYDLVYSRVMFPASHFLAFEYKLNHPKTKWVAEFSDPILYDIKSNVRESKIKDKKYLKKIDEILIKNKMPKYFGNNLFFLCEYLAYIFADEILFTNMNQKQFMIDEFPYADVAKIINKKSTIKTQPTLPKEFYYLTHTSYKLDNNYVNFAYFGSFYETRNLEEVFDAFEHIDPFYQDKYRLHIFTSDVKGLKNAISNSSIKDNIQVNSYVSFFEFLNLSTKFQCLIVNDASTKDYKKINPYLPSKLSDYIGSETDIWGICEKNSIMSEYNIKYTSFLEDKDSSRAIVKKIMIDHFSMIIAIGCSVIE
ncbi:MAG: glycosyltransferase family 2 protein [Euryarchaeota archaeon]|nr:glycosyltransferase family 2 protein [Euryarchaeota archaeon]MBV1754841.1 glycosyltransferase family 2 protein [Methanobacterium sp.]